MYIHVDEGTDFPLPIAMPNLLLEVEINIIDQIEHKSICWKASRKQNFGRGITNLLLQI